MCREKEIETDRLRGRRWVKKQRDLSEFRENSIQNEQHGRGHPLCSVMTNDDKCMHCIMHSCHRGNIIMDYCGFETEHFMSFFSLFSSLAFYQREWHSCQIATTKNRWARVFVLKFCWICLCHSFWTEYFIWKFMKQIPWHGMATMADGAWIIAE